MSVPSDTRLTAPTTEDVLLSWLLDALRPMSRTRVKEMLRSGRIRVNGVATTRHDHPICPGDQIAIARTAAIDRSLATAGIQIYFEDEALIVLEKPTGLLTVATASEKTDTAFARLNAHLTARGQGRPFVVHRLDRETSGLLLFARSAIVREQLQANWANVAKTYLAIVEGKPPRAEGTIENYLKEGRDLRVRACAKADDARHAVTHYRILAEHGALTLLEVQIETGRKHQIRVHLASLGCAVIGDPVYGSSSNPAHRLGLHAHRLTLPHPSTHKPLELISPLPIELIRLMALSNHPKSE